MTLWSRWPQRRHRNFPTGHRILAFGAPGTTAPNLNTDYGAPQVGSYDRFPEPKKRLATQRDIGPDSPLPARVSGPVSKTGGTPSVLSDLHDIDGGTKELAAKIFFGEHLASAILPSVPVCGVSRCVVRNDALPTTPSPAPGGEGRENESSISLSILPESTSPAGSCEEGPDPGTPCNSTTEGRSPTPLAITVKNQDDENFSSISAGTISNTSSSTTSSPDTILHATAPLTINTPTPGHGGRGNDTSDSPHLPDDPSPTTLPIGYVGQFVSTRSNTTTVASQTHPPAVIPTQFQNSSLTSTETISTTSSIQPGYVVPQDPSSPFTSTTTTTTTSSGFSNTKTELGKVIPETTSNTTEDFPTTYSLTLSSEAIRSTPFPNILPGPTTSTQSVQGTSAAGGSKSSINTNALIGGSIAAAVLLLAASVCLFFHFRRRPTNEEWCESFIGGHSQLLPDSPLSTHHIELPPPPGPISMTMQTESATEWRPTSVGNSEISALHAVVRKRDVLYLDPPIFDEHLKNLSSSSLASFDPQMYLMTPDPFAARSTPIQNPFSDPVPLAHAPFAISKSERARSVASTSTSESHHKTYGVAL